MAYLSQDDYTRAISMTNLTDILAQAADQSNGITSDQIKANAENLAMAEVKARLDDLFSMTAEFTKTSTNIAANDTRDQLILTCVISCAIFHLHMSVNPNDVPDVVKAGYDRSIEWITMIRDGKMKSTLTRNPIAQTGGQRRIELYSAQKFLSKPYEDPALLNPEQFQTDNAPIQQTQQ